MSQVSLLIRLYVSSQVEETEVKNEAVDGMSQKIAVLQT